MMTEMSASQWKKSFELVTAILRTAGTSEDDAEFAWADTDSFEVDFSTEEFACTLHVRVLNAEHRKEQK